MDIATFTEESTLNRQAFERLRTQIRRDHAGKYVAFAQVFAWYYDAMANGVTDALVAAHRIALPEKLYTYAVRVPQ